MPSAKLLSNNNCWLGSIRAEPALICESRRRISRSPDQAWAVWGIITTITQIANMYWDPEAVAYEDEGVEESRALDFASQIRDSGCKQLALAGYSR